MDDVFVYIVDLPAGVKEAVLKGLSGFTVYISDKLDPQSKKEAYCHALQHIENDDWSRVDVQEIEADAHAKKDI